MDMSRRFLRRVAGLLKARLPDLCFHTVPEVRHSRGQRLWGLSVILKAVLVGLVAGCKGLGEMEELTAQLSRSMRRMLGIGRRVPDTTARDILVRLTDTALRPCLVAQVKAARRRKALVPKGLPFGVVAIDGKATAIDAWDDRYSQRQRHSDGDGASGIVRTLSCTLVSGRVPVYLDVVPVPPSTNETGTLDRALRSLHDHYGPRVPFALVAADAAQCYRDNAALIADTYKHHYLLRLKGSQPTLLDEAKRRIGPKSRAPVVAQSHEVTKPFEEHRRLTLTAELSGFDGWSHMRTVLCVERDKVRLDTGQTVHHGARYFISSLPVDALTPQQWLRLVRCYWAVENEGHHTLDAVFAEDRRPWIRKDPQGMVAVLILRRIACNLVALFRGVTLRSDRHRTMPWKTMTSRLRTALVAATPADLVGLRPRTGGAAPRP